MTRVFDIDRAVQESGLPAETVAHILEEVRQEFPEEELMYELHIIRALEAEAAVHMSPKQWADSINQQANQLVAEQDMEHVAHAIGEVPILRQRNKRKKSSA